MFHYYQPVQNRAGDVLPGYFVQVIDPTSLLVVPIYSDRSGTPIITTSGIANMAKVDVNGMVSFYVLDGNYNVNVYAQDNTTLKGTYLDVPMVGGVSLTIGTVTTLAAGAPPTASIDSSSSPAKLNLGLPVTTGAPGTPGAPGTNSGFATLFTAAAGMTIAAGITSIRTAGYSVAGKGAAFYVYDAAVDATYVSTYSRAAFLAADSRGFRLATWQGSIQVEQLGALADGLTDDTAAWTATETYAAKYGCIILAQSAKYYLANGFNFHKPLAWLGAGGNSAALNVNTGFVAGTTIRTGKNCNGFVGNKNNTHGDGTGSQGDASGLYVHGFMVIGGNANVDGSGNYTTFAAGDSTTGHGVRIRGTFQHFDDVAVACFGGSAFNIACSAGSGGSTEGNANNFRLTRCFAEYCGGWGLVISGTDCNAGFIDEFSAISCAAGGGAEYSFLGNHWGPCHMRDCGVLDSTGCNLPTGTCVRSGLHYYVVAGHEAAASTSDPATDGGVNWARYGGHPSDKTWITGLTWSTTGGAPYATNPANSNGRSSFDGCYAESAQPPCQIFAPSVMYSGLLDEVGVVGTGTWMRGSVNGGVITGGPGNGGGYVSRGANCDVSFGGNLGTSVNGTGDEVIAQTVTSGGSDRWNMLRNSSNATVETRVNGVVTETMGLLSNTDFRGPYHRWVLNLWAGNVLQNGDGGRLAYFNANGDLTGKVAHAGSQYYLQNPVAGGRKGQICTTSGTIGSGAVMIDDGIVGGVQTATSADPASMTAAAGVNSVAAPTMAEFNALVAAFNQLRTDVTNLRTAYVGLTANMRTARQLAP